MLSPSFCPLPLPHPRPSPPLTPLQVYSHPKGDHIGLATRFTLPVRALAYSPSGLNLAVAGDDEGVKLVDMSDAEQGECRVFRQLPAQARGPPCSPVPRCRLESCSGGLELCIRCRAGSGIVCQRGA